MWRNVQTVTLQNLRKLSNSITNKMKLRGFSLQAYYTDLATAAFRRS
jgi:hypothetical protein